MDRARDRPFRMRPSGGVFPRDAIVAVSLFVALFAVFWLSPNRSLGDAHYAVLVSESILRDGDFYLDEHFVLPLDQRQYPSILRGRTYPYQVVPQGEHLTYAYDPGGPLLAIPFIAAINLLGPSAIAPDGGYHLDGERLIQQFLASTLMAGLAVLFFAASRTSLPLRWSVLIALAAVLGTQIWSTASRALWSHTWGIVLFGIVVLVLLEGERRGKQLTIGHAALIATVLAWSYFIRPTNAIYIVAVSGYVLYAHRRPFFAYALVGAAWFAIFSLFFLTYFDQLLPLQMSQAWGFQHDGSTSASDATFEHTWPGRLTGVLMSPSRGLFIYVPITVFVLYLLVAYRRTVPHRRIAVVALIAITGQLLLNSSFLGWWGGHAYGPRLPTELVPWLVLLGILGLRAMLEHRSRAGRPRLRIEGAIAAVLLALSVAIHARGALAEETVQWNATPVDLSWDHARLWDWESPQFLAGLVPSPTGAWLARAKRDAPSGTRLSVEVANDQRDPDVDAVVGVDSLTTATLTVSGWAIDEQRGYAAGGVILTFDERTHVVAACGFDRSDVAEYFGDEGYRFSGFSATIPVASLGPGRHIMRPLIVTADGTSLYEPDYLLTFDVH
jgi:hypothetical protein